MDLVKTEFVALDERFARCNGDEWMQRLHTGCRWTEGPVYFPAGRYLVFSDIPNDRTLRWDETTGHVGVFRQPSNYANGHTRDRMGRLVSCEQGRRRVTRTEPDGTVTVLAEHYGGRRLNSPNDVVERSDGSIWFTDPSYGIDSDYEGYQAESEIGACHVYRVDPANGEVRIVADDFERPNGLAFSVDESRLYVADTRQNPSHIRVFDVADDGTVTGGEVFGTCDSGSLRRRPGGHDRTGLGRRPRRPPLFRAQRHSHRQATSARDLLEPDVRRTAPQRALHHRVELHLQPTRQLQRGSLTDDIQTAAHRSTRLAVRRRVAPPAPLTRTSGCLSDRRVGMCAGDVGTTVALSRAAMWRDSEDVYLTPDPGRVVNVGRRDAMWWVRGRAAQDVPGRIGAVGGRSAAGSPRGARSDAGDAAVGDGFLLRLAWPGFVVLLLGACSVGGDATVVPAADDVRAERSHTALGLQVNDDEPGCSAAVGVEGKVVWAGARGVADLASGSELTTGTVFDIGSVSKQFTAAAVLLLADGGDLSIGDTVSEHLSGLPAWAGQVTIAQLIHHTSGVPDFGALLARRGHAVSQRVTQAQIMRVLAATPALGFTPGARFEYSNSNYLLLAEIVRGVSGIALPRLLQERVFDPLGLDMVLDPDGMIPGKAVSYRNATDNSGPQVVDSHWETLGPGGIQTTPSELVRWGDNYRTGTVGGQRLFQAQLADPVRTETGGFGLGPTGDYGAGIVISGNGTLVHTGGWEGFGTAFEVSPDRGTVLAVACNSSNEVPTVLAAELRKIWS